MRLARSICAMLCYAIGYNRRLSSMPALSSVAHFPVASPIFVHLFYSGLRYPVNELAWLRKGYHLEGYATM